MPDSSFAYQSPLNLGQKLPKIKSASRCSIKTTQNYYLTALGRADISAGRETCENSLPLRLARILIAFSRLESRHKTRLEAAGWEKCSRQILVRNQRPVATPQQKGQKHLRARARDSTPWGGMVLRRSHGGRLRQIARYSALAAILRP